MHSALADFIEAQRERILDTAIDFARTVSGGEELSETELRDHFPSVLETIVTDLRTPQTEAESVTKSQGNADDASGSAKSAAATHALDRASSGYSIGGLVSEYRSLRASVLRLWAETCDDTSMPMGDVTRFNEAIDEAIAESVLHYADEMEHWRDLFLGVLGHELRSPLTAIVLSAERISRLTEDTQLAVAAKRLLDSTDHMHRLLNKLLVYNHEQLGIGLHVEKTAVDLSTELGLEVDALRSQLPRASLALNADPEIRGHFDAARLREVVCNLVVNAHKYGKAGGTIDIDLHRVEGGVEVTVGNAGDPIAPEALENLFDPLHRGGAVARGTEPERLSLGLGLFVVRKIAEAHGGSVDVESTPERTTFTVFLADDEAS